LAGKTTKDQRKAAYFIIGNIGKNKTNSDCAEILIRIIRSERDKYALSTLLDLLAEIPIGNEVDLSPIFELLTDDRWLVRYSAISALKNTSSQQAEEKLLELLQRTEDAHDMVYCHSTLNRIGSARAIPAIERGLKSRKRDVKLSAEQAIASITQRVAAQPIIQPGLATPAG